MKLSELKTGEKGVIVKVLGHGGFRKRIIEMGFIKGKEVEVLQNAPLQDPVIYKLMGYEVSLRHQEADMIEVVSSGELRVESLELATATPSAARVSEEDSQLSTLNSIKTITFNISQSGSAAPLTWHSWAIPIVARPRSSTTPAVLMAT